MLIEQEVGQAIAGLSSLGVVNYVRALEIQALPYIIVEKITSPRSQTHQGVDIYVVSRIQVSVFADNYIQAKTLAAEIYGLSGYSSNDVSNILLMNEQDMFDDDAKAYEVIMDFRVTHYEVIGN